MHMYLSQMLYLRQFSLEAHAAVSQLKDLYQLTLLAGGYAWYAGCTGIPAPHSTELILSWRAV